MALLSAYPEGGYCFAVQLSLVVVSAAVVVDYPFCLYPLVLHFHRRQHCQYSLLRLQHLEVSSREISSVSLF